MAIVCSLKSPLSGEEFAYNIIHKISVFLLDFVLGGSRKYLLKLVYYLFRKVVKRISK